MRKIREYKPGQQDRGVAVVLTIGVLGMMLMLTMAFAASALMSHRIATLNRDTVLSRLAAEMGVQRAYVHLNTELSNLNDMRNLFPATKPGVDGHIGPDTASTAWDGRTYWFSENDVDSLGIREAFAHQLAGVDITPDDTHAAPHEDAGWIHVYHPDNATEIIARMSYVLIDESGKIDPNYAISQGVAEGSETTARYGLSPADLNLAGALPSALSGDLQYDSHSGGDLATTMQWLSHYHIFRAADSAEDNSDAVLESLFPHSYDIEAFNDSLVDRHRFDLTNADWDAFGNDVAASSLTSAASEFWNGTAPAANIGGIPMACGMLEHISPESDRGQPDRLLRTATAFQPQIARLSQATLASNSCRTLTSSCFSCGFTTPGPSIASWFASGPNWQTSTTQPVAVGPH